MAGTRKSSAQSATNKKSVELNKTGKQSRNDVITPKKSKTKTQTSTGKRKRNDDEEVEQPTPSSSSKKQKKQDEEKRLKRYRNHAPQSFLEKLSRAQSQRMIVVGRTRLGSGSDLREEIDVVGTTGNIYKVTIGRLPECTCPDHLNGNECKHKVYALHTILKAPEHLQYQRALLVNELDEIFSNAPPIPSEIGDDEDKSGKRKPVEGECPICYMDFEEEKNELVWCKAACGNNMHKSCFEQWQASQRGKTVRCVYCRAEWEMDNKDVDKIKKAGVRDEDGYINVAEQFGLSRERDYSSYHQPWVRRRFGEGW